MKEFMYSLVKEAGKILRENYDNIKQIDAKSARDIVTNVDKEAEEKIKSMIKEKFPDHAFLGEESGQTGDNPNLWIVDPIDGTKNYAKHISFFNTSIAFSQNKKITHGIIYDPIEDEIFYAEKGKGAFLNDKPIKVSETDELIKSFVCFCRGVGDEAIDNSTRIYRKLAPKLNSLRQFGAAALELGYLAAGRIDAFYSNDIHSWDIAAGILIVREAGGKVTDWVSNKIDLGKEKINILASNEEIHEKLKEDLSVQQDEH